MRNLDPHPATLGRSVGRVSVTRPYQGEAIQGRSPGARRFASAAYL